MSMLPLAPLPLWTPIIRRRKSCSKSATRQSSKQLGRFHSKIKILSAAPSNKKPKMQSSHCRNDRVTYWLPSLYFLLYRIKYNHLFFHYKPYAYPYWQRRPCSPYRWPSPRHLSGGRSRRLRGSVERSHWHGPSWHSGRVLCQPAPLNCPDSACARSCPRLWPSSCQSLHCSPAWGWRGRGAIEYAEQQIVLLWLQGGVVRLHELLQSIQLPADTVGKVSSILIE